MVIITLHEMLIITLNEMVLITLHKMVIITLHEMVIITLQEMVIITLHEMVIITLHEMVIITLQEMVIITLHEMTECRPWGHSFERWLVFVYLYISRRMADYKQQHVGNVPNNLNGDIRKNTQLTRFISWCASFTITYT